ncbi:MAG: hypothetical protein ACOY3Z_01420 [Thermodesulfobacteriota bacterium]
MGRMILEESRLGWENEAVRLGLGGDFADLFAARGWNLYEAEAAITSPAELDEVICRGRVRPAMEGQRYILLPRTSDPDNPAAVRHALASTFARYPLFVDEQARLVEGRTVAMTRGVYIIDSVLLARQRVVVFIDIDAMLLFDVPIPREIAGMETPCLLFDVLDMYDRIGQVSAAFGHSFAEA